jgi:fused signal recognition particle receptor
MDNLIVYIVIGVVVVIAAFFALRRRPELTAGEQNKALPKPADKRQLPADTRADSPTAKKAEQPATAPQAPVSPEPPRSAPRPPGERAQAAAAAKAAAATPAAPPAKPAPPADVSGIRKGLAATRGGFIARLRDIFVGKKEIDPAILQQIEEVMLSSDVGVKTTQAILGRLKEALDRNELRDENAVWAALRAEAVRVLNIGGGTLRLGGKPSVVLMVGVNGVGKTTTIGKLATRHKGDGQKVVLAAGDTFRAAAVQQLEVWGKRIGVDVIKGKEGGDPAAVAFEATTKSKESGTDLLLIDTAGRLHTKAPLMDEMKKVRKSIAKAMEGAPHETLLVLDATTGQNALTQAAMFKDAVELTGIILTKLDGTAKGGIILGICDELKVPVRYIGLGERAEDLREFRAEDFVEALFGRDGGEAAAA